MAWNQKSRVVAVAVAIQLAAGAFTAPNTTTDIVAAAPPTNQEEAITADDPTATGSIWQQPRVYLGKTASLSIMVPLRGPGGSSPPSANAWVPGRMLQAAGFAEVRTATALTGTPTGDETTSAIDLGGYVSASGSDNFYVGMPIQHADIGTGIKANSLITAYNGTSKLATIGEVLGSAPATTDWTIPANLTYQQGTLSGAVPLLSVSIWRDKKRYDFRDVRISQLTVDMPVANESNQVFPSVEFQMRGIVEEVDDDTTPAIPESLLIPIPPYRNGKFSLDKVPLGHQSMRYVSNFEVAGPSNAHAAEGQDAYEIMSGSRSTEYDLNQMAVSDFDIDARVDGQTEVASVALWGTTAGNRFGFCVPGQYLDPLNNPGDRNGFVNLTGNGVPSKLNKGATLSVWW